MSGQVHRRLALRWTETMALYAAVLLALAAGRTEAQEEPRGPSVAALEEAFVKAIETAERSVVAIAKDRPQPVQSARPGPRFGGPFQQQAELPIGPENPNYVPSEFGAGVIIDSNHDRSLILTNYHVVRGGPVEARLDLRNEFQLYVRLNDRRSFSAAIYAADPRSDLAVLRIPAGELRPMKVATGTKVRKGQFVIALGNPYALARDGSASATWGIVSNITRSIPPEGEPQSAERQQKETLHNLGVLLQVDTRLELGTSGGALLNLNGELIGLTTALAALAGYEKSAGLAVPIDESTKRVIDSLKQGKEVEYGFLGISPEDVNLRELGDQYETVARRYGQHTACRVRGEPIEDLPASGFLKDGDIILRIGNKPIYGKYELMREVGLLGPAARARFTLWRPMLRSETEVEIELGKWPAADEEGIVASTPTHEPWRGIVYDYPTARSTVFGRHRRNPEGFRSVLVTQVLPGSPAAAADLQRNDRILQVDRRDVRNPREFAEAVRAKSGMVTLTVLSLTAGASKRDVTIRPR
jgi:serine protease Do